MSGDGGPAFPIETYRDTVSQTGPGIQRVRTVNPGMTLRDYFAGQALNGLMASPKLKLDISDKHLAKIAYEYAEAMLKARK